MADLRLSRRAANDLTEIADYTISEFGVEQARLSSVAVDE